ncbi:cupin domain-containing protein [Haloarchaeobius sp. DYHT-AS-18]|uniref:cupin domain-containing protein n=1 Tax=Haloarchaeobius sp. DYHT-AS-18 TaxID=3446117 RepID=UPI003EC08E50
MERVSIDALDPEPEGNLEVDRRPLSDTLGTTDMALNHYRLAPGDCLVGGMHAHMDQEEVFYVLEGVVTFETTDDPGAEPESVRVEAGEVVSFGRGEYQQGRNADDYEAVVLAMGAPPNSTSGREPRTCGACGDSEYLDTAMIDGELKAQCLVCDTVHESGLH